ncbi:MAG: glycosyl hydrolase 115 family protein [Opitutales bacterium]|nr:glycosyl hydrolase 115 family protein [Opitutales bacterium]
MNVYKLPSFFLIILFIPLYCYSGSSLGLDFSIITSESGENNCFPLVTKDLVSPLFYDSNDYPGVVRALGDLQQDIFRVTSRTPSLTEGTGGYESKSIVLVGSLDKSSLIQSLVSSGKLCVSDLKGTWENYVITCVDNPFPGVNQALVVVGSDKRGTIYGIYELSEQMGVSPWSWWADVPVKHKDEAYVLRGRYTSGEPVVKYRGIFLNDEAPCLTQWSKEKFGGFNHKFYEKVFELLLRLRANYLWPAMWDNAFNCDDVENPRLADEYGIVMGTSHHEPMMRAHKEWTKNKQEYGNGKWNYTSNAEALKVFFREGINRSKNYENIVTIGMRGDGDVGMDSTGDMQSDIDLIERIMADQRIIISEEMGCDLSEVPQVWALFTEVQKFYENGLQVPDDVTLLWCDDNNGSIRRLPTEEERKRSGGAGIYYHLDMHGGPFAYQWINTNPLPKIQEQFYLASEYGANRIWIVNVGDLKPLEVPLEFIMRMAWNPKAMTADRVSDYLKKWAKREFGDEYSDEIADIVAKYAKYNGLRKPELITADTFSPINYNESDRISNDWDILVDKAERIYSSLPQRQRDAFYQLVLHPTKASATVFQMQIAAGRNHLYAKQGRASTNNEANLVRKLFHLDQELSDYYNHILADGKWNHLMDQPHLGQYSWEPPRVNSMPPVSEVLVKENDDYGVSVEGDISAWPDHWGSAVLPTFDSLNSQKSYFDVFAEGSKPFEVSVTSSENWIVLNKEKLANNDLRYWVDVNWSILTAGKSNGTIYIEGKRGTIVVQVNAVKATQEQYEEAKSCYASLVGPVSINACNASRNIRKEGIGWELMPDYGRVSAAMTIFPVTAKSILLPQKSPSLEYDVYLPREGTYSVDIVVGPVMDFVPDRGMRIAVSFDEETSKILDIFEDRESNTFLGESWYVSTKDNARFLSSSHHLLSGKHILKIAMVDPGIVIQKIIIHDKPLPYSYLGPKENRMVSH